jgi:hypothetical protein
MYHQLSMMERGKKKNLWRNNGNEFNEQSHAFTVTIETVNNLKLLLFTILRNLILWKCST